MSTTKNAKRTGRNTSSRLHLEYLESRRMMATTTADLTAAEIQNSDPGPTTAIAHGDFNDDGYQDIALGMPAANVGSLTDATTPIHFVPNAGAVRVIYGSPTGLNEASAEMWYQDRLFAGTAESSDRFGAALAVGDFNGDQVDDLAVGSPGENSSTGQVQVIYGVQGSVSQGGGLTAVGSSTRTGRNEGDEYGSALASGDFNRDFYSDLAVGAPEWDVAPATNNGRVYLLMGNGSGLYEVPSSAANPTWGYYQGRLGTALGVGDFDRDGYDDLAVGEPGRSFFRYPSFPFSTWSEEIEAVGAARVYYGSLDGLVDLYQLLDQSDLKGELESGDRFGAALAVGDFNGDRVDDLAVGVPNEGIEYPLPGSSQIDVIAAEAGAVNIIFGKEDEGLRSAGNQLWHQHRPAMPNDPETNDHFGAVLVAGNFNGDINPETGAPIDDLAIGVPGEDYDGKTDVGMVQILQGSQSAKGSGLVPWPSGRFWIDPEYDAQDQFGIALGAGDIDRDGRDELAVSSPAKDGLGVSVSGDSGAGVPGKEGAVHVLFGSDHDNGPGMGGWQVWREASQDMQQLATPNYDATLPTAGLISRGDTGTVIIHGTELHDHATVETGSSVVTVTMYAKDDSERVLRSWQQTYYRNQVADLIFSGYDGNDVFRNETNIDSVAHGHAGDDRLLGGSGRDILYGDDGLDQLFGRDGEDFLDGGYDGQGDLLDGGRHSDTLVQHSKRNRRYDFASRRFIYTWIAEDDVDVDPEDQLIIRHHYDSFETRQL